MKYYIILLIVFLAVSCSQKKEAKMEPCEAVLIEDCSCLQVYEPVCGCDNKTYPNSCYAECSSVMVYTEGECP